MLNEFINITALPAFQGVGDVKVVESGLHLKKYLNSNKNNVLSNQFNKKRAKSTQKTANIAERN